VEQERRVYGEGGKNDMKKTGRFLALAVTLLLTFTLASCSGAARRPDSSQSKAASQASSSALSAAASSGAAAKKSGTLVAYFSCTGTTKGVAEKLAAVTGGTLYAITPSQPYTSADLNYNDSKSRTTVEQNDQSSRPKISGKAENWEQYDTVFLGYPIWWGTAPRILDTFVGSYDFSGKTVIPFCTSSASGIGQSGSDLAKLAGTGTWLEGKRFGSGTSSGAVTAWFRSLNLKSTK
jgi:flavodoxin